MKRRELVAGVGSLGVLAAGSALALTGLPSIEDDDPSADDDESGGGVNDGPIELKTIDAPGSEAGTITVPNDGVTVAMFFSITCGRCGQLMEPLGDAYERLEAEHGDDVTFVTIMPRAFESEIREWWREHDGNWYLGHDKAGRLATRYRVAGTDVIAIDADGEAHWRTDAVLDGDRYARKVESVLEESRENETVTGADDTVGRVNDPITDIESTG